MGRKYHVYIFLAYLHQPSTDAFHNQSILFQILQDRIEMWISRLFCDDPYLASLGSVPASSTSASPTTATPPLRTLRTSTYYSQYEMMYPLLWIYSAHLSSSPASHQSRLPRPPRHSQTVLAVEDHRPQPGNKISIVRISIERANGQSAQSRLHTIPSRNIIKFLIKTLKKCTYIWGQSGTRVQSTDKIQIFSHFFRASAKNRYTCSH